MITFKDMQKWKRELGEGGLSQRPTKKFRYLQITLLNSCIWKNKPNRNWKNFEERKQQQKLGLVILENVTCFAFFTNVLWNETLSQFALIF